VNEIAGGCHCGAITIRFMTARDPSTMSVRECQCSFCRKHGARSISDRDGHVTFRARADALVRYQFSTRSADFLVCRRCGVYVAALMTSDDDEGKPRRSFATVNARALAHDFAQPPAPVEYGHESADERLARRRANWTPADLHLDDVPPHDVAPDNV
jgi:hypothetical protein